MPWPNLTPQELAAYQQLLGGGQMAQPGGAQQMTPQMQAYMAMLAQQQPMNPAMGMQQQQPTMANMLAARPNAGGGITPLPTTSGYTPGGGNMSTILNNPQLMQMLMRAYGGGGATT